MLKEAGTQVLVPDMLLDNLEGKFYAPISMSTSSANIKCNEHSSLGPPSGDEISCVQEDPIPPKVSMSFGEGNQGTQTSFMTPPGSSDNEGVPMSTAFTQTMIHTTQTGVQTAPEKVNLECTV